MTREVVSQGQLLPVNPPTLHSQGLSALTPGPYPWSGVLSGWLGSDLLCLLLCPVRAQECKQVEYGATVGPSPQTGVAVGGGESGEHLAFGSQCPLLSAAY